MTKEEVAATLNGRDRDEITRQESKELNADNLVVVYGASGLMEFSGAIDDECSAPRIVYVDRKGIRPSWDEIDHDDEKEAEKYFARKNANANGPAFAGFTIEALWCAEGEYSWTYKTEIPHATFEIVEDGRPYCRGIVFSMNDL